MDELQIPEGATFRIQLATFEGPLDLLLHLIKKHELNILDLPIAFVTERYLDYLQMMQELDLDVASEYLLMAATLAHIKSKMLLPQNPLDEVEEQEDGYVGDPRAELIRRLLEYQKYRAAAEQLGARPIAGRDVFGRGVQAEEAQGPAPLAPIDLYKLLDAFGAILKRVQGRVALEVTAERITIHERISEISELLRGKRSCVFEELFAKDSTRYEVIVTFLALLEMTKLRMTRIYQADPSAPLHVQYALLDADADVAGAGESAAEPQNTSESDAPAAFAAVEEELAAADAFADEDQSGTTHLDAAFAHEAQGESQRDPAAIPEHEVDGLTAHEADAFATWHAQAVHEFADEHEAPTAEHDVVPIADAAGSADAFAETAAGADAFAETAAGADLDADPSTAHEAPTAEFDALPLAGTAASEPAVAAVERPAALSDATTVPDSEDPDPGEEPPAGQHETPA